MARFAELGLKHVNEAYNAKGASEYVLVETIGYKKFRTHGWCVHENFKAKPKDASDDEARLFFLELKQITGRNPPEYEVTICYILEPHDLNGDDSGRNGCKACKTVPKVLHPLRGFDVGPPPYRLACCEPKILAAFVDEGAE